MKFFQLLHQRDALLRAVRLANLAFAYHRLGDFASRVAQARLQGDVHLQLADPTAGRPWPTLTAEGINRSVIEEHFIEGELVELGDILEFLSPDNSAREFTFRFEDVEGRFLPALRDELRRAGVSLDHEMPSVEDSNLGQA